MSTERTANEQAHAKAVREMFSGIAKRYDFLNHFLSLGRDIAWRRATARTLHDVLGRPGSMAVDVCCGTGDLALALARRGAQTIGLDFNEAMLRIAEARKAREQWEDFRPRDTDEMTRKTHWPSSIPPPSSAVRTTW